jgi:hypothetical protein
MFWKYTLPPSSGSKFVMLVSFSVYIWNPGSKKQCGRSRRVGIGVLSGVLPLVDWEICAARPFRGPEMHQKFQW